MEALGPQEKEKLAQNQVVSYLMSAGEENMWTGACTHVCTEKRQCGTKQILTQGQNFLLSAFLLVGQTN